MISFFLYFKGDMCIPYYTGKVIDILGEHYQPNSFMSAILIMGLLSLGRYECYSKSNL